MINVTNEIKELLLSDGTRKNVRISFPNNDHEDICNDHIVKDSTKFTESLCSQDTLKLGLAELSCFECEVVGVDNIKGLNIRADLEVYCNENTINAVYKEDLEHYVYIVPYGYFVVNSCKRQTDLTHRKIIAYSYDYTKYPSKVEVFKQQKYLSRTNSDYEVDMMKYILSNNTIADSYAESKITVPFSEERVDTFTKTITFDVDPSFNIIYTLIEYKIRTKRLYFANNANGTNYSNAYTDYNNIFELAGDINEREPIDFDKWFEETSGLKELISTEEETDPKIFLYPSFFISGYEGVGGNCYDIFTHYNGKYVTTIYPYFKGFYDNTNEYMSIDVPVSYESKIYKTGQNYYEVLGTKSGSLGNDFEIKRIVLEEEHPLVTIKYKTQRTEYDGNPAGYYHVEFPEISFDKERVDGLIELNGQIVKVNKDGFLTAVSINSIGNLYPSNTLYPSESEFPIGMDGYETPNRYTSGWYDEEFNKQYGRVLCHFEYVWNPFNGETHKGYLYYYIVPVKEFDESKHLTYDISNNYWIKDRLWTIEKIRKIIRNIGQKLAKIKYIPCDISGIGQPWLESGDTIGIETKDGSVIKTIILNRTLSGEQNLTDVLQSK